MACGPEAIRLSKRLWRCHEKPYKSNMSQDLRDVNESPCSKLQGIKRDRNYLIPLTLTLSSREREYA